MRVRLFGTAAAILILIIGCRPAEQAETPERPDPQDASEEESAPAGQLDRSMDVPGGGEAATESASGQSDPACVGRLEFGTAKTLELQGWKAEVNGFRVDMKRSGVEAESLTLGVIADVKEDTGENMLNLGRIIGWWRSMAVDAVVVAGDAGETEAGLARVLGALAEPGWPVMVISGNREARAVYVAGVERAQKDHQNIFNLAQKRLVALPGATLVSLPGYHDPRFLHQDTGCQYFSEDVEALLPVARQAEGPVVLVAHSGPRGATPEAIDFAREAGNVGDANINRLISAARIPFGIFAHIHEAGGKASDLLGHDLRVEGAFTNSLYLNVGPADSLRWEMNDGSVSQGMAGIVRFQDGKATYWVNRLAGLDEEQIAQARLLDGAAAEADAE